MKPRKNKRLTNSQRKKFVARYNQLYPTSIKIYSTFTKKFVRYTIVPCERVDWAKWNQHGHCVNGGYFHPECKKCTGFGSTYGYVDDPNSGFGYKPGYVECDNCGGSGWGDFVTTRS